MILRGIREENIEQEMQDIAGLRVMVQFVDDVDEVLEVLRNRTDMRIVQERDYIKNKKSQWLSELPCDCRVSSWYD